MMDVEANKTNKIVSTHTETDKKDISVQANIKEIVSDGKFIKSLKENMLYEETGLIIVEELPADVYGVTEKE